MNEDGAMRDKNDKENQKYSYIGNHFQCYLPIKMSNRTSLSLIPGLRGERQEAYRFSHGRQ